MMGMEKDGKVKVPIITEVPSYLMSLEIGVVVSCKSDYDIMSDDKEQLTK